MREKLETLSLVQLRDIAKQNGIKKISTLKKDELIDVLLEFDRKQQEELKEREEVKENLDEIKEIEESKFRNPRIVEENIGDRNSIEMKELDSGETATGILEVMPDGFGFIRSDNFLPGSEDVYVAPSQIKRFKLKTGDIISGSKRIKTMAEKFSALLYINTVNGYPLNIVYTRPNFEELTPI